MLRGGKVRSDARVEIVTVLFHVRSHYQLALLFANLKLFCCRTQADIDRWMKEGLPRTSTSGAATPILYCWGDVLAYWLADCQLANRSQKCFK